MKPLIYPLGNNPGSKSRTKCRREIRLVERRQSKTCDDKPKAKSGELKAVRTTCIYVHNGQMDLATYLKSSESSADALVMLYMGRHRWKPTQTFSCGESPRRFSSHNNKNRFRRLARKTLANGTHELQAHERRTKSTLATFKMAAGRVRAKEVQLCI